MYIRVRENFSEISFAGFANSRKLKPSGFLFPPLHTRQHHPLLGPSGSAKGADKIREAIMKNIKERANAAAELFLERKGYAIIATGWEDPEGLGAIPIIAEDERAIVFIEIAISESMDGFPGITRSREDREKLAARFLFAADKDLLDDRPVRFDSISFMLVGESKALLRHHINELLEG